MRLRRMPQAKEIVANSDLVFSPKNIANLRGNWEKIFANDSPIYLEVGMGRGKWITAEAAKNPKINYIGLEMREEMIFQALERLQGKIPPNIRFLWVDASNLPLLFTRGEVDGIYLHFSDPWPKLRHAKRRLTHPLFLKDYDFVLKPKGQLNFKTDNQDFFDWSLTQFAKTYQRGWRQLALDRNLPLEEGQAITEYEKRFRRMNQPIYFCSMQKEDRHMYYVSTRGNYEPQTAAEAICLGMVPGGGLFVPQSFPNYLPKGIATMTYQELACDILGLYLDDYDKKEIKQIVWDSYNNERFDDVIAPCVTVGDLELLELWHGPTAAFKDMALQIMPRLLKAAIAKTEKEKEVVILVATSGDTGKAALEGFKNMEGIKIIVFYPCGGVSRIQELQMLTTDGHNTYVVGVDGNFDDCQNAVKAVFANEALKKEMDAAQKEFSSANSINWGRLLPQIVYYYYAYGQMVAKGKIKEAQEIDVTVPTGNFGNILAAYYARRMGLPIHKLICASNENKVLTDVIKNGTYDRRRPFYQTDSPSMDILISSNFERFIYEIFDRDGKATADAFQKLQAEGFFAVSDDQSQKWGQLIYGDFADRKEAARFIGSAYRDYGYVMDPHTGVAVAVANKYRQQNGTEQRPMLVVSTASPYKFPKAVLLALGVGEKELEQMDDHTMLTLLQQKSGIPVHRAVANIEQKPVLHQMKIKKEAVAETIRNILSL